MDTIFGILLLNLTLLVMQHRAYINPRYTHIPAHLLQTGVELLDLSLLILDVGISQDIVVGGDRALDENLTLGSLLLYHLDHSYEVGENVVNRVVRRDVIDAGKDENLTW